MRVWRLILPLFLLLAGCAGPASQPAPRFLHEVPVGTLLSLERQLPFKAGTIRVYLQDGRLHQGFGFFGHGGVNRYRPYCMLELNQKPASDLVLEAREYRMEAVRWDITYQMMDTSEFRTEWRLSGGGEPQAYAFTCFKADNAAFESHLTLQEIDHAVGEYFRLKEAGGL